MIQLVESSFADCVVVIVIVAFEGSDVRAEVAIEEVVVVAAVEVILNVAGICPREIKALRIAPARASVSASSSSALFGHSSRCFQAFDI
jgi:hypothetical protein